jgi:hypothetical protein
MTRKRVLYVSGVWFLSLSTCIIFKSCENENVEDKFYKESAGKEYYMNNVYPVLSNKCFSCHNYHNSTSSRYDTYSKAAGVAEEMRDRTHAANASIMPPVSSAPLTEQEKAIFRNFLELVEGGSVNKEYKVSLSWTAHKFPDSLNRAAVSGTFNDFFINYKKKHAGDIYEYLKDAEIIINSNSVNSNNDELKNYNLRNYFFSVFSPVIYCKVTDINPVTMSAIVNVTMNGISENVFFEVKEEGEDILFRGTIRNINNFNSQPAIDSLHKVCGTYHQNKLWPDISVKAEISNYKKLLKIKGDLD